MVFSMLLAGCSLQGDVPFFGLNFPAVFQNAPDGKAVKLQEYTYKKWWTRYEDPLLNTLIEKMLDQNLEIEAAAARSLQAQEQISQARGALYPSLSLDSSASRVATPSGAGGFVGGGAIAPGGAGTGAGFATSSPDTIYRNNYELGLSASWQVDLFGRVRNSITAAQASLQASEAEKQALVQNLITQLIGQRVTLATLLAQIELTEQTIENRERTLESVERRYKLGSEQASALEVRLARENLESAKSQLPPLEADYAEALYTLDILLGEMPGTNDYFALEDFPLLPPPDRLTVPPPLALLDRRPDLIGAAYRVEAAQANIGVAMADLYPNLSLSGDYGYQASELNNLISPEQIAWSLIGNLTAPLFEGGRLRAAVRLREAEAKELAANYAQQILQAVGDVETALKREDELRNQLSGLDSTLEQSQAAYDLAYRRYTRGLVPFTDLLEIERRLFQTRTQLLQIQQSVWQARLNLMLALGGDWLDTQETL